MLIVISTIWRIYLINWAGLSLFDCPCLGQYTTNNTESQETALTGPSWLFQSSRYRYCISFKFFCRSWWWWWLVLVWSGLNLGKLSIKRTSMSRQREHYIMSVCGLSLVFRVITWSEAPLLIGWSDRTITLHSSLDLFYQLHKNQNSKN